LQVNGFNQTRISGNFVAGAQQDDIADYDVTRWNNNFLPIRRAVAVGAAIWRRASNARSLRYSWAKPSSTAKKNDEGDGNGLGAVTQKNRERRGHQQDSDQDVF